VVEPATKSQRGASIVGEWWRLAPDDIMALREIKALRLRAEEKA